MITDIDKTIEEAKAGMLPYESWEQLTGEGSAAFAAFCAFRDYGPERTIRNAVDKYQKDKPNQKGSYGVWRKWAIENRWKERAADYDRYREHLKQEEMRKTIEAQGECTGLLPEKCLK